MVSWIITVMLVIAVIFMCLQVESIKTDQSQLRQQVSNCVTHNYLTKYTSALSETKEENKKK